MMMRKATIAMAIIMISTVDRGIRATAAIVDILLSPSPSVVLLLVSPASVEGAMVGIVSTVIVVGSLIGVGRGTVGVDVTDEVVTPTSKMVVVSIPWLVVSIEEESIGGIVADALGSVVSD